MRNCLIASTLLMLVMFAFSPLLAQTASRPQAGVAKAIPDLSGIWVGGLALGRNTCGEPACLALQGVAVPERLGNVIKTLEEPQMLPWAEEKYKAAREGLQDPNDLGRDELNPWLSGCASPGPAWIMLNAFEAVELRQFRDVVLLLFEDDHAVQRIYLDGKHPADWKPTVMGHSIGSYDAETLVVDTIGINDKSWIDLQGHPHSDALHLMERIRRVDPKTLEIEITIDDPKAYKKPWTKKIVRQLAPPGPQVWDGVVCDELLKIGTHYSAKPGK